MGQMGVARRTSVQKLFDGIEVVGNRVPSIASHISSGAWPRYLAFAGTRADTPANCGFADFACVGLPSTVIVTVVGVLLVPWVLPP